MQGQKKKPQAESALIFAVRACWLSADVYLVFLNVYVQCIQMKSTPPANANMSLSLTEKWQEEKSFNHLFTRDNAEWKGFMRLLVTLLKCPSQHRSLLLFTFLLGLESLRLSIKSLNEVILFYSTHSVSFVCSTKNPQRFHGVRETYNQWFSVPFGEENLIRFQEKGVEKVRWVIGEDEQVRKVEYSLTQYRALQNTILIQFHSHIIINW